MPSPLKIRDLEMVVALHEEGSLTQAAKRIGISEPAYSKRIHWIERCIRVNLFDKGHDGIKTTEAGRSFIAHALESLHSYHKAVHEAHEARNGARSQLCIGVSSFMPPDILEVVRSVELPLYRNLTIAIETEYSMNLLSRLQQGHLDVALISSPPVQPSITTQCLYSDALRIVFREGHPLMNRPSVTLAELAEYPWIFFSRTIHPPLYDLVLQRLESQGKHVSIAHRLSTGDQAVALLKDDSSVAWMTPTEAARATALGFFNTSLLDERIHLDTHLATRADNRSQLVSEYVRRFVTQLNLRRPPEQMSLPIA